jgi:hypothetical protein
MALSNDQDAARKDLNEQLHCHYAREICEQMRAQHRAPLADALFGLGTWGTSTTTRTDRSPREAELARQLAEAQHQITQLQRTNAALSREVWTLKAAAPAASLPDTTLKELIVLCHPDKWPDNPLAHEITVRLNKLRETTKG